MRRPARRGNATRACLRARGVPIASSMPMKFPRLAARAVIVEQGRLLLVNAYPGQRSDLWCAPAAAG